MLKLFKVLFSGVGAAGATFFLQVLLSHKLSMHQFGIYVAANSSLTMIGPFAGMGIGGLFLRKSCVDNHRINEYFSLALKCLIVNIIIAFFISQVVFHNTGLDIVQGLYLSTYYLAISFQYLVIAQAQVTENFFEVSLGQAINPFLRLFLVLLLILVPSNIDNTIILLAIANVLSFMIFLKIINHRLSLNLLFLRQKKNEFFRFFKETFFYSFNGTINVIQIQCSVLMAMYIFGSNTSGFYSSAIILLTACYIIPNIIFGTYLLPQYHKLEKNILKKKSLFHGFIAFLFGIVFFSVIYILAGFIIKLLYPETFKYSAVLLKILAFSIPFRFYATAIGASLLNEKCIRYKVLASFLAFVFQLVLMFFLKNIGAESISISFVFSEIVTAILYSAIFFKYFQNKVIR